MRDGMPSLVRCPTLPTNRLNMGMAILMQATGTCGAGRGDGGGRWWGGDGGGEMVGGDDGTTMCGSLYNLTGTHHAHNVTIPSTPTHSGREITIATIYSILGKPVTENLTVADVWANATQQGMRQIQRSVTHLDFHDRDLLEFMVGGGCRGITYHCTPHTIAHQTPCTPLAPLHHRCEFIFIHTG